VFEILDDGERVGAFALEVVTLDDGYHVKARAAERGAWSSAFQRATVRGGASSARARARARAWRLGSPMSSSIVDSGGRSRGISCSIAGFRRQMAGTVSTG
jgi:hypothetical protein